MKLLFTSEEVIEICDGKFYSMNLGQHLTKYKYMGDIVCVCYCKKVEKTKLPEIDKNIAEFIFTEKENNIKTLFVTRKRNNDIIKEQMYRKDINMLVCHVPSNNSYHSIKYAKILGKPYLLIVVGCVLDSYWNYNWRGKCLAIPSFLFQRNIIRKATHVLYVTEHFLQKRYPTKGIKDYASNVCIEKVSDLVLKNRLKKINKYSKDSKLNIVTVAAVDVPYKGQKYVIQALAILNKKMGYNYHYYMVGGGDNNFLKRIAEECGVQEYVHFMGALPHDEVIKVLDEMDLYIQPSKQEGLPRALIEAMSRALPAIGTRVAGIPELLNDNYLIKKGSVSEIVRALSTLMKPDNMSVQAKNNFNKASKYTLDIINDRRLKFFNRFIQDNKIKI